MHIRNKSGIRGRWIRILIFAAIIGVTTTTVWWRGTTPIADSVRQARQQYSNGDYVAASRIATRALQRDSNHPEALWIAGQAELRMQQYQKAVSLLERISADSRHYRLAAQTAAQIHLDHLSQLGRAAELLDGLLQVEPLDIATLEALARLHAVTGARAEAIPLILQLVQLEQSSDLLMVLARETGSIADRPLLERAAAAVPDDPLPLTGLAQQLYSEGDPEAAAEKAREALLHDPAHLPARRIYGQCLIQTAQWERLRIWLDQQQDTIEDPEILVIRGLSALHSGHRNTAADLLVRGVQKRADQRMALWQLSQLCTAAKETSLADELNRLLEDYRRLQEAQDDVFFGGGMNSPAAVIRMLHAFESCGRIHEAAGWAQLAVVATPENPQLLREAVRLTNQLQHLPLRLTQPVPLFERIAETLAAGSNLSELTQAVGPIDADQQTATADFRFLDTAAETGLDFTFINGSEGPPTRRMMELTGGGIAVVDLDGDTWPDLAMTQGGLISTAGLSDVGQHQLFRNQRGQRFENVTIGTGLEGHQFGQGITAGDLNEDGFSDLVICGIGGVSIWMNNGDGTLHSNGPLPGTENAWLTSCAIADLNADSVSDLVCLGYLRGEDLFQRLCQSGTGDARMCSPSVFSGEADLLLYGNGDGTFSDGQAELPEDVTKGLGLLIADLDDQSGLEILIAADTTPNQMLTRPPGHDRWNDRGFAAGIALSSAGKAEGSMGIAATDLNHDGIPDVAITNFLNESTGLYLSVGSGTFLDQREQTGLRNHTRGVLGFGAQFLDANLDGVPELFVTNGHIDNLESEGVDWKMPSQLLAWLGNRFSNVAPDSEKSWLDRPHLGRSVARMDWNHDGLADLAIGTLYEASALLTNHSTAAGSWIALELSSANVARIPVGTKVRLSVEAAQKTHEQQLTAGDGYQCSNEKTLLFAVSRETSKTKLEVAWPDGTIQSFDVPQSGSRYRIIQNTPRLFEIPE